MCAGTRDRCWRIRSLLGHIKTRQLSIFLYFHHPKSVQKKKNQLNLCAVLRCHLNKIKGIISRYATRLPQRSLPYSPPTPLSLDVYSIPPRKLTSGGIPTHLKWISFISNILVCPRVRINNTDAKFVIVYFCPQREYQISVNNSPLIRPCMCGRLRLTKGRCELTQ